MKKYSSIDSSTRYLNIDIFYSEFLASKKKSQKKNENNSLNYAKDIENLLKHKDIENYFYSNGSLNDEGC